MIKKIFLLTTLFLFYVSNSFSENFVFLDFNKVLNQSKAGASAQVQLKKKFQSESEKYKKIEKDLKKNETDIISQKKIITNEEYRKKVDVLRKKVANHQNNKQTSFKNIAKSRAKAKNDLLEKINPIIKKYMEENKIRLVVDKDSVLMGDATLEITNQIIKSLNEAHSSLAIN
jgi:Skp family chaperone for outer membrane proteins|tara:strand:+ start:117 stop:635 length:519 start_codon:yes stop_codon:yes gene_type:complete